MKNDTSAAKILSNYQSEKHFLQTIHLPAAPASGQGFCYMKNHKAACTSTLAAIMEYLQFQKDGKKLELNFDAVHWPPKSLILMGPRRLSFSRAIEELNNENNFRFSIVRDPLTRTVSAFADKILGAMPQKKRLMNYLGRPANAEISLSEFLDIVAQDPAARNLDRHWRAQRKEISYDYIDFDFVGTVAKLSLSMEEVFRRIFYCKLDMQDTRMSLGHRSNSKQLIDDMSAKDVKNIEFAYEMDFDMYEDVQVRFAL